MQNSDRFTVRYISAKTYSAIVQTSKGEAFLLHYPFINFKSCEKNNDKPISPYINKADLKDYLTSRVLFMALVEMNDFFVKINNGSIDILDDNHFKERLLEKLRNNTFLLQGEGKLTIINWLSISFLFVKMNERDISDIKEVIEEAGYDSSFVKVLFNRFGSKDKRDLVDELLDSHLEKMKNERKWQAFRQATFIIFFIAKSYAKNRISDAKKEYETAIDEFERNTGIDANYKPMQRHTDRFTRNQHFISKRNKKTKEDDTNSSS